MHPCGFTRQKKTVFLKPATILQWICPWDFWNRTHSIETSTFGYQQQHLQSQQHKSPNLLANTVHENSVGKSVCKIKKNWIVRKTSHKIVSRPQSFVSRKQEPLFPLSIARWSVVHIRKQQKSRQNTLDEIFAVFRWKCKKPVGVIKTKHSF